MGFVQIVNDIDSIVAPLEHNDIYFESLDLDFFGGEFPSKLPLSGAFRFLLDPRNGSNAAKEHELVLNLTHPRVIEARKTENCAPWSDVGSVADAVALSSFCRCCLMRSWWKNWLAIGLKGDERMQVSTYHFPLDWMVGWAYTLCS